MVPTTSSTGERMIRPRAAGASHYGMWDRAWVGLVDMLGVAWLQRRMKSPDVEELDES